MAALQLQSQTQPSKGPEEGQEATQLEENDDWREKKGALLHITFP